MASADEQATIAGQRDAIRALQREIEEFHGEYNELQADYDGARDDVDRITAIVGERDEEIERLRGISTIKPNHKQLSLPLLNEVLTFLSEYPYKDVQPLINKLAVELQDG